MEGHHLILGTLNDYITGEKLDDTHDERYRQIIARDLVEKKNYLKSDIKVRYEHEIRFDNKGAIIKADFLIIIDNKALMLIKYAPGSIVTRERSTLAASRIIMPYQIPFVVTTNGENAHILNGITSKKIAEGISEIPSKVELMEQTRDHNFEKLSNRVIQMEQRIIYTYEIDGACPCDNTICKL